MSIRRDTVNLEIRINGEASGKTMRELKATASQLNRELRELPIGSDAFVRKSAELKKVNTVLSDINSSTKGVGKGFSAISAISFAGLVTGAIALGRSLFDVASETLKVYDEAAKAEAQVAATLESTNNSVGKTLDELKSSAAELQKATLFDDDAILKTQATLLTFTNVTGENFDTAITSIADMSTLLGTDLQSSAIQVGKALNDPLKGVASLGRAGVQFSEDQKTMIKSLVDTGKTAEAQKIILEELETQFGGSAKAAAEAGLGPYTVLRNRLGDVQESVGLLISNGLEKLAPVLNGVVVFIEKFVNNLVNGEKATGSFSIGVNLLANIIRVLYNIISFTITQVGKLFTLLSNTKFVINSVNFIKRAFEELAAFTAILPAIWSGFVAGGRQAVTNIGNFINSMILSFKLLKLEVERALTFTDAGKKSLDNQINAIKSRKDKIKESGKTVGEAYSQAFKEAVEKAGKEAKAQELLTNLSAKGGSGKGGGGTSPGGGKPGKPTPPEDRTGKANNLSSNEIISIALKARQEALKASQKVIQDETDKELDILLTAKLKGEVTEQEYALRSIDIKKAGKEKELLNLTQYNETETNGYRDKYNELLQLNADFADTSAKQRFDLLTGSFTAELSTLEAQYLQGLITEEEYQNARLELKKFFIQQELDLLSANGLSDTEAFRAKELEKLRIQKEIGDQSIAQKKREAQIKQEIESASFGAFNAFVDLAIDASNKETGTRKKNAELIKQFEKARILVNLYAEISGYWKAAASLGALGTPLAIVQSITAGARAALGISKVNSQKFQYGGLLDGPSHTYGGVPITMGGAQVAEAEGGEAFINKRSTAAFRPVLSAINSFNGWGRKFETGGVLGGLSISPNAIAAQAPTSSLQNNTLERKFEALIDFLGQGLNIRANVVYTDLEATSNTVAQIRAATRS